MQIVNKLPKQSLCLLVIRICKRIQKYQKQFCLPLSTVGRRKVLVHPKLPACYFLMIRRRHMKNVLDVAIDLHNQGKVVITQKGIPVDVNHIKGPVRIKVAANTVERLSLIFIYVI